MYSPSGMNLFFQRKLLVLGGIALVLLMTPAPANAQADDSQVSSSQGKATEGEDDPNDKAARGQRDRDQNQNAAKITAVPNRPTFSTTAEAVQRGVLEVEYGVELAAEHQNINGLIKFGIFNNLELRFANNPFVRDGGIAGMGDSGAGFKYRIFSQEGLLPTFSVLYTASISTSTGTPGIGAMGHGVDVLLSKDFGKHHFDFNEGVRFLGRPGTGGYDRNYFTAFDYAHPLPRKWGYAIEIAGFSRANAATPASMVILLAATYNVSPRLVLDAGEYTAVYGKLPRVTFFLGVTYSIADLYRLHRSVPATIRNP
ncbi:MAG: hypothetical protein M3P45_04620 [Acidobacteriota bacterium]|nr:hypothetical protein [Acidobacteriota bacterium]